MENGDHDKYGKPKGALKIVTGSASLPPGTRIINPEKEVKYRFNFQTRQVEADNLEIIMSKEEREARDKVIAEVQNRIQTDLIWTF